MSTPHWADIARRDIDNSDDEKSELSIQEIGMKVLEVLRRIGKHNTITIAELSKQINFDIEAHDEYFERLKNQRSIEYEDGTFRFKPLVDADTEEELINSLRNNLDGVTRHDVLQSNENAGSMIDKLVREGRIIGTHDEKTDRDVKSVYPRLRSFKTQLSGTATVKHGSDCIEMTYNVSREIRHGDAVIIDGRVYRVCSRPRHIPLSVSSIKSLDDSKDSKSGWEHTISKRFYLDKPYAGMDKDKVPVYKFGATNDVRELWFDSCDFFYTNESELQAKIQQANLGESILTMKKPQYKRTRKDV